jgi:hypothetical protein
MGFSWIGLGEKNGGNEYPSVGRPVKEQIISVTQRRWPLTFKLK